MKWFKKKIAKWAREGRMEEVELAEVPQPWVPPGGVTFRIYPAQNGQVLEFTHVDKVKHEHYNTIYIIDKDTNISEYVSKCLSLEMLK